MKKSVKIAIAVTTVGVIAAGIGFGVYNYNRNADTSGIPKNATPVQLEETHTETIRQQITAKGVVELVDKYPVYPKGQGRVSEVLVKKGDVVSAGQVIARYDRDSLDSLNDQLTEAQLALKTAELSLQSALLPVVSEIELSQAETGIIQAENSIGDIEAQIAQYDLTLEQMDSNISLAEKKYDNTNLLYDRGVASKQDLDAAYEGLKQLRDQRATVESQRLTALMSIKRAEDAVDRAEEQYELTLKKQDDPQVANRIEQQKLQVEQAKLRISQIQHQLDKFVEEEICTYDGIVLEMGVSTGETASAVKPLIVVASVDAANQSITVNVPEADAVDLSVGQEAEIRGNALGSSVYSGTVGKIADIAEEQMVGNSLMRVLAVEILPSENANLKAGYTIEATIITRVVENAVVVPLMATMSSEDGEDYIYVMRDDFSVERRVVTLGGYSGMYIEALSGVSNGEKVVINPPATLKDGGYVKPIGTLQ